MTDIDVPIITRVIKKGVPFQHLIVVRSAYTHWPQHPSRARAAMLISPATTDPVEAEVIASFTCDIVTPEFGILLSLDKAATEAIPVGTYPFDVLIDIDPIEWTDYVVKKGFMQVVDYEPISPTYEETYP